MLWLSKDVPVTESLEQRSTYLKQLDEKSLRTAAKERIAALVKVANMRETKCLLPYFVLQGVCMSYTYGNYPTFIRFFTEETGSLGNAAAINIAVAFLLHGISAMIGSAAWGRIYDRSGSRLYPLLATHTFLVLATFILLCSSVFWSNSSTVVYFMALGYMFGQIDSLTNSIINSSISKNYDAGEIPTAFAFYRFYFCIGFALTSWASSVLPDISDSVSDDSYDQYGWLIMVALNVGLMLVSVIMGVFLERKAIIAGRRPSMIEELGFHH